MRISDVFQSHSVFNLHCPTCNEPQRVQTPVNFDHMQCSACRSRILVFDPASHTRNAPGGQKNGTRP